MPLHFKLLLYCPPCIPFQMRTTQVASISTENAYWYGGPEDTCAFFFMLYKNWCCIQCCLNATVEQSQLRVIAPLTLLNPPWSNISLSLSVPKYSGLLRVLFYWLYTPDDLVWRHYYIQLPIRFINWDGCGLELLAQAKSYYFPPKKKKMFRKKKTHASS